MSFKKIICVLTAAAAVLSFAGCADSGGNITTVPTGTSSTSDDTDKLLSDMFTDRDIEVGYDENTDTMITLSDSGTMCKSSDITVNGGTVTVCGPTSGGDGALDCGEGATAQISGGTVFAFGSSGMAENFSSAENQGAALVALSGNAGDTVTVKNSDGTALASAVSDKKYECVVVSCAGMTENGTFTVTNGTNDKDFTLNGFIYGERGGFGGMGGNRGGEMPTGENGEPPEMPTGENGEPPEMPTDENGNNSRKPDSGRFPEENGEKMTVPNGESPGEPPTGSDGRPERPAGKTTDKNLQNSQNT